MSTTQWLDFEKEIVELCEQLEKARETQAKASLT
jgi:hypothetical protein